MKFIWRMARREIRSSWKRLLFFFLCIGIGVGAIVALRSTIQNVNVAMVSEARNILTADVQVDSSREMNEQTLATIKRIAAARGVPAQTQTIEAATMLRPADDAREGALMVELKGIEAPYPLYGEFKLANGETFTHALLDNNGVVVAASLLERLSLKVGDVVKIGNSTFEIRGVMAQEPGATGSFRLGPRVFIARNAIAATGLTGFGSRARNKVLLQASPSELNALVADLRAGLKDSLVSVRSYRDSQEGLNEQYTRSENYLSLTGLVILVLGGIGVSNVTRVFIEQKKRTIAVLKCVGASSRVIAGVYLAQVLALGLAGSLFGVVLAKGALLFVARRFAETLPANMSYELTTGAIAQGLTLGLLISLLFSALPLLRVRHIKPNMLLREDAAGAGGASDTATTDASGVNWLRRLRGALSLRRIGAMRALVALGVVGGLIALAAWQAGSLRVGAFFMAGLAVTAGALQLAAMLVIFFVRRARHVGSFPLRHAVNSMYRPGNQTRVVVLAVGLGAFLVIATQSLQKNLVREFDPAARAQLPNMFLIDVQKDQKEGVEELIRRTTGERATLVPTVRTRIAAINGQSIDLDDKDRRAQRGMLGREYVVTYRPQLEANETIVAGTFWDSAPSSEPEVSVEEGMRGLAGLDLNSTITFDITGRRLTARVTSIRRVDWRNSRTGFLVLFRPGVLENAPQMLIAPINGPTTDAERGRFQRVLLDKYPNISVIDVADIMRAVTRILNNVTLAVSFIGGFVLLSGVLILVGSIAMTKWQRVYEAAVLKTLGAKRKVLLSIMLAEYGLLGLTAGTVGTLAAVLLSYSLSRFVFEIPWNFTPWLYLAGLCATVLLVAAVGALSSFDAITRKPLAVLRAP
ncbi:MAG: putative transport system permease protein [Acidobacteriota bacterium]|nr:putative transport system permease protein [Acidobacteriota bacterium]